MTKFNFPSFKKSVDLGEQLQVKNLESPSGREPIDDADIVSKSLPIKEQLYMHAEKSLQFMRSNDLAPPLPNQVNIVFTNVDRLEMIGNYLSRIRGKELPPQYGHLSCVDPETATIYVSSSYLTKNSHHFDFANALTVLFEEFNHDIQKILDREIYHEIGHLGVRNILPRKEVLLAMHPFQQRIRNNIEEGFADAFSLHMMAVKHGHLEFPILRAYIFNQVKDDPFREINLYRVYDDIPFKNSDGSLVTDIQDIMSKCLETALKNNKEMLLECLSISYYEPQVKNSLNLNFRGSNAEYIDHFHDQYKKEGIIVNINNLRSTMLGTSKYKNNKI